MQAIDTINGINGINGINNIKSNTNFIKLCEHFYPGLELNKLDNDIINDIIQSIVSDNNGFNLDNNLILDDPLHNINENNELIYENFKLADELIPEMLLETNSIYLDGKINNIPVKILFDTGATTNCIYKSKIIECGLDYLIDTKSSYDIIGVNSTQKSYGTIWYVDLDLKLNNNLPFAFTYTSVGVNLVVLEDLPINNCKLNSDQELKIEPNKQIDIILGIGFMKAHRANIDFHSMTITLNSNIKINFA